MWPHLELTRCHLHWPVTACSLRTHVRTAPSLSAATRALGGRLFFEVSSLSFCVYCICVCVCVCCVCECTFSQDVPSWMATSYAPLSCRRTNAPGMSVCATCTGHRLHRPHELLHRPCAAHLGACARALYVYAAQGWCFVSRHSLAHLHFVQACTETCVQGLAAVRVCKALSGALEQHGT